MEIDVISLFPDYFVGPFDASILQRAQQKGLLAIRHVQLRDFALDKHRRVDDRPFGGGPGMVLKPEPVHKAIQSVRRKESHVVFLSPQGRQLDAAKCQELAHLPHLVLLCGHYEGIDERVLEEDVDEEISIGDYVLTNGALAAIVLIDALARFIPGVLGHEQAAAEDSFQNGLLDCPHYTRPEWFEGKQVPPVLLNGDHQAVADWRKQASINKTRHARPDLYLSYLAQEEENFFCECTGKETFEVVLFVKNVSQSLAFYKKVLKLEGEQLSNERAFVRLGQGRLVLVEGSQQKDLPLLLKLIVSSQERFESVALHLIKLKRNLGELKTISGEDGFQLPFTDLDGYPWMIVFLKGEKENNGHLNSRI